MKPLLKLYHPFPGVGVLKIYKPMLFNDTTISFCVMVDNRLVAFKLHQNGEWDEIHKEWLSMALILFIRQQIEELYPANHLLK